MTDNHCRTSLKRRNRWRWLTLRVVATHSRHHVARLWNWIDHQENPEPLWRAMDARFPPAFFRYSAETAREDYQTQTDTPPAPQIAKIRLDYGEDTVCMNCDQPLFDGEVAWRCSTTFAIGCCLPCCRDAAASKIARFEGAAS